MTTVALSDFKSESPKGFPEATSIRLKSGAFVPKGIIDEGVRAICVSPFFYKINVISFHSQPLDQVLRDRPTLADLNTRAIRIEIQIQRYFWILNSLRLRLGGPLKTLAYNEL